MFPSFAPPRLRLITPLILAIVWVNSVYAESRVILQTPLGDVHIELFDDSTPQTVANFLNYVRDGDYEKSFIHRSIPGFVIQGGGYTFLEDTVHDIPTDPPVINEPGHSNVRGTIAMAKLGGDPDSATSQWYINLTDNSDPLDADNGGYTVFGQVIGDGMDIIDDLAELEVWNAGSPFENLPLIDYPGSGTLAEEHLVMTNIIETGDFSINSGHSGSWFNPETSGQGVLIDAAPDLGLMFIGWFTYTDPNLGSPGQGQWYSALGEIAGNSAMLTLNESSGGEFDSSREVTTDIVGEATIEFTDCEAGTFTYTFDDGRTGSFPIQRAIPGSGNLCRDLSPDAAAQVSE